MVVVLFFDFDWFKLVNDLFGYGVGDQFFVVVVSWVRSCLRESDLFVCFGGDEFIVFFI